MLVEEVKLTEPSTFPSADRSVSGELAANVATSVDTGLSSVVVESVLLDTSFAFPPAQSVVPEPGPMIRFRFHHRATGLTLWTHTHTHTARHQSSSPVSLMVLSSLCFQYHSLFRPVHLCMCSRHTHTLSLSLSSLRHLLNLSIAGRFLFNSIGSHAIRLN